MTDYVPIPCALYERYEVAILHHTPLRVGWRDARGMLHVEALQPRDLITREGAEFLLASRAPGGSIELRLDCIVEAVAIEPALPRADASSPQRPGGRWK
jgi:transcriptional antiterminator Rof (Rho-off)